MTDIDTSSPYLFQTVFAYFLRFCLIAIIITSLCVLWSRGWSYENSVEESDAVVVLKHSDVNGEPTIHVGEQEFADVISFGQAISELNLTGDRIVIQAEGNVYHQQIDRVVSVLKQTSEAEIVLARKSSFTQSP